MMHLLSIHKVKHYYLIIDVKISSDNIFSKQFLLSNLIHSLLDKIKQILCFKIESRCQLCNGDCVRPSCQSSYKLLLIYQAYLCLDLHKILGPWFFFKHLFSKHAQRSCMIIWTYLISVNRSQFKVKRTQRFTSENETTHSKR